MSEDEGKGDEPCGIDKQIDSLIDVVPLVVYLLLFRMLIV